MKNKILELANINKKYTDVKTKFSKKIAENLSLSVMQGEIIGIIGKNGIGKTTLLNIIVGITKQDSGTIKYFFDRNNNNPIDNISFLFQESTFPKFFKVKDIVKILIDNLKFNKSYDENLFNFLIDSMAIKAIYKIKYKKLSGGEKQKINLLSVLCEKKQLILLDEFSTSLDINSKVKIRNYLLSYIKTNPNCSVIMVSHDFAELIDVCSRVLFLDSGKLIKEFLKEDLSLDNLKNVFNQYEVY